jgi:hypothetical protein
MPSSRIGISLDVGGGAASELTEVSFVSSSIGARTSTKVQANSKGPLICNLRKARPKVRHDRSLPWVLRLSQKQTFVLGDPKSRRYWLELR